jgi:Cu+-exporting ATPase
VPGDHIIMRDQELVPVDAILRAGTGHIDNSFITGEPLAVRARTSAKRSRPVAASAVR